MSSPKRDLAILGMFGAALFSFTDCSLMTKVDWSLIPPEQAGGKANGGETSFAGATDEPGQGGQSGEAGAGGEAGASGEAGEGGSPAEPQGGFGGTLGGSGGTSGGGAGGTAAGAGMPPIGPVVHPTCSKAPATPNPIPDLSHSMVFFDGGKGSSGNRGGRAGLDKACTDAKTALHLPQSMAAAVISVAFDDQLIDMPERYNFPRTSTNIVSPIGTELAASWNELWLGAAPPSLVCSGVMPETSTRWLTGTSNARNTTPADKDLTHTYFGTWDSTSDMSMKTFNNACNGWMLGDFDTGIKAHVGSTTADRDPGADTHPRFIDFLIVDCDKAADNILCIAFNPAP